MSALQNNLTNAATAAVVMLIATHLKQKAKKKKTAKKRVWCRDWLKRRGQGKDVLAMLDNELRTEDPNAFRNFLRMTNQQFEKIVELIKSMIHKKDTIMRDAVSARNR